MSVVEEGLRRYGPSSDPHGLPTSRVKFLGHDHETHPRETTTDHLMIGSRPIQSPMARDVYSLMALLAPSPRNAL